MLFNSYIFLFVFLPVVLLGFYLIPSKKAQLIFLLAASLFFYSYWSAAFVFLLLFTVVFDFYLAKAIESSKIESQRKSLLVFSIVTNLSILGFFKYFNFFAENVNYLLNKLHSPAFLSQINLVLPIGISFYTFQSMSYVIDVYRGHVKSHGELLPFASYVTLFPHQISGPLVRHDTIVPQLENSKTYFFNSENFWKGFVFFAIGLSKKVLIADRIADVVDPLIQSMAVISNFEAWLATLGYTMQLYFDFSGYSDMAVGLGLFMNIKFPANFNSPYKATSITDFWQRWHITLSSWLKSYLYISLGGNRQGGFNTYRNLLLTMIIGGFWHGAQWSYLIWGTYHGFWLVFERMLSPRVNFELPVIIKKFLTFTIVSIGWIFFRGNDLATISLWLKKVFLLNNELSFDMMHIPLRYIDIFFAALSVAIIGVFFFKNIWQWDMKPRIWKILIYSFVLVYSILYFGEDSPFLYFQF